MNPHQHLILIKGEDKTLDVESIHCEGNRTIVAYRGGKTYPYGTQNVDWRRNPIPLPVRNSVVSIRGDLLSDVVELVHFDDWVRVFHRSGKSHSCQLSCFRIIKQAEGDERSQDLLAYYRELAACSELRTEHGDSLLSKKYMMLERVPGETLLAPFLSGELPSATSPSWMQMNHTDEIQKNGLAGSPADSRPRGLRRRASGQEQARMLIFPFGCNMSQKQAVAQALIEPVSVIQGPPGTGKTQTILNLIANLLLSGKQMAIVSNNNAATENVQEKLEKHGLDFFCALLGSKENKDAFLSNQSEQPVQTNRLQENSRGSILKQITGLNHELDTAYSNQNELASARAQLDALILEMSHYNLYEARMEPHAGVRPEEKRYRRIHSEKIAAMLAHLLKDETLFEGAANRPPLAFWERVKLLFQFGPSLVRLSQHEPEESVSMLHRLYYHARTNELRARIDQLDAMLANVRFEEKLDRLQFLSMQILHDYLGERYNNKPRRIFSVDDLWRDPQGFSAQYPVVLSTTFSVITAVTSGHVFDCAIVDEASQVDLLNGVLALGCARKMVVVGDRMQLPHVVTKPMASLAKRIASRYVLPDHMRYETQTLLSSIQSAFPSAPQTLLREHYRCHPKIIQFCNSKFYDGKLLIMTRDAGEPDVLKAYVTVKGNHARGTSNQRQIDEIVQTVIPELGNVEQDEIGVVSPFRAQVEKMQTTVGSGEVEVKTVHMFQGREKKVMIITTVSNETNDFIDNPNLLNVAVSRAREKLRLVVSHETAEGTGNIADLVRYIRYSNCDVVEGKVCSVFDLLYGACTTARLAWLKRRKAVSEHDSESLLYEALIQVLMDKEMTDLGVLIHMPLAMLLRDDVPLTAEESRYAQHPWTHVDFCVYRKVDKSAVLVIEVDGVAFHQEGSLQAIRDKMKNEILRKSGVSLLRLSTNGSRELERIADALVSAMGGTHA